VHIIKPFISIVIDAAESLTGMSPEITQCDVGTVAEGDQVYLSGEPRLDIFILFCTQASVRKLPCD